MGEPGTPKPYKMPCCSIDSMGKILHAVLPEVTGLTFSNPENDIAQNQTVISSINGKGAIKFKNGEEMYPIEITIVQLENSDIKSTLYLSVGNKPDTLVLQLQFESESDSSVKVTSLIQRSKLAIDSTIPKGYGIELYNLIPRLMSALAKENNLEYTHEIERSRTFPIREEKWLTTFRDFIRDNGYVYIGDEGIDLWTKSYTN